MNRAGGPTRIRTDIDFDRNGRQVGVLRVPHSHDRSAYGFIPIPIASFRNGDGPTLLLVGGNHGDEFEGPIALIKLIGDLVLDDLSGRVIVLPLANMPAVWAGARCSPVDGGNLNRSFPGDPDGGPTAMIAHYIEHELLARADAVIDIHSGGASLHYAALASTQRHPDPDVTKRSLDMLRAFAAPLSVIAPGHLGENRTLGAAARRRGIPMLGTELGGGAAASPETVAVAERGIRGALRWLGIVSQSAPPEQPPMELLEVPGAQAYVYATTTGIFEPRFSPGQDVGAGDIAGLVHCLEDITRPPEIARFAIGGKALCRRALARVGPGDCLAQLATKVGAH